MKKLLTALCTLGAVSLISGCADFMQPVGIVYSSAKLTPLSAYNTVNVNNGILATKTGTACVTGILLLVATGDNSIEAAKLNGGITKVSSIQYHIDNVLGIYDNFCTEVKGE